MFGLLKHHHLSKDDYAGFRKNYCGTCKTIGKLYGQKERLYLNNDIVFLSELLAEINNCPKDFEYIKINSCFALPAHQDNIPKFLKYSASVNILLAYYKVTDNIEDSKYRLNVWRLVKKLQNSNFKKAGKFLEEAQLPADLIHYSIKEQFKREAGKKNYDDLRNTLTYYSSITGEITGEVFRHGAFILDKPDLSSLLYSIGSAYGKIVYLSDAVKDFKEDTSHDRFNLFRLNNSSTAKQIDPLIKQRAYQYVSDCACEIQNLLALLPLTVNKVNMFMNRLWHSLDVIFYAQTSCEALKSRKTRISFKERINHALNRAHLFSGECSYNWIKRVRFIFFAGLLILLFISFPNIIHASQPYHEEPGQCCKCCGDCCCDSICEGGGCGC